MPILLILLVIGFRFYYFQPVILPRHDTFIAYSTFYYFYNYFFYHFTFPQWMPKITYGIPTLLFQFFSLSPVSYLVIWAGKLCGTSDVLFLFKSIILVEELIFVLGVYYLVKTHHESRWIATAISLAAIISMESYTNIFFNLRIVYFIPWAILFLWQFVRHGQAKYFWMSILTFILGSMGNSVYIPIVIFYLLLAMTIVLGVSQKLKWESFWPRDAWTKIMVMLSGVLFLTYILVMFKISQDLSLLIRSNQALNPIHVFLTYGNTMDVEQLFIQLFFFTGNLYTPLGASFDNTIYVGMLIGLFFMVGLFYCRDQYFKSAVAGLLFIILFSSGGLFSQILFHLPGMGLYRHIGLTGPLIKLMVLIVASFGMKFLFEQRAKAVCLLMIPLIIWFVIMEGQDTWHSMFISSSFMHLLVQPQVLVISLFFMAAFLYWSKPWGVWVKGAILIVLIVEALVFQHALKESYPKVDPFIPPMVSIFGHVRPMQFDQTRLDNPPDLRWPMMTMVQKSGRGGNYVTMFNALDFDACHTDVRVDVVNKSVVMTWNNAQDSKNDNYLKIIGCNGYPKNALLAQVPLAAGQDIYQQAMPFSSQETSFDADRVTFNVSSVPVAGWFYYADSFHPGWKAWVNGVPTVITKTADGFKAVAVDTNCQKIDFRFFDPLIFVLQYLLCLGALLGLGLLTLRIWV